MMLAAGRLETFRACCGDVHIAEDESATLDRATAAMLEIAPGDSFLAMGR
jgi:arginine/ornithine N-succinyltransferase beta subunit